MDANPSVLIVGFILSLFFTLIGTYVAIRAAQLRRALEGRDGYLLMGVLTRMTAMLVAAMWIGVFRMGLALVNEPDTQTVRVVLQTISYMLFMTAIAWTLVQIKRFRVDNRLDGPYEPRFVSELNETEQLRKGKK